MSQSQLEESAFEKRLNPDNTPNKKYVDVLDEDKPIANQKFVCVSFVSPETILKKKDVFLFQEFVKQFQLSKSMEKYHQFLNFVSYKFNISSETLLDDFKEFAKEEIDSLKENDLYSDYKNFLDVHEDKLTEEFNRTNNFQTSVRGMKVRGVYPTQDEAELRCKMLREIDPHHDVYVGPVGLWMPWEPDAYKTGRVEFMEDELNQLMHEKNKNQEFAKESFDKRVKDTKRQAIEKNIEDAQKANTVLTQDIDNEGNLITVGKNTQEDALEKNDIVSVADIRSELFEGDNIVTDKDTDKGLSKLSEFAKAGDDKDKD
jgi:hypothetical protein